MGGVLGKEGQSPGPAAGVQRTALCLHQVNPENLRAREFRGLLLLEAVSGGGRRVPYKL